MALRLLIAHLRIPPSPSCLELDPTRPGRRQSPPHGVQHVHDESLPSGGMFVRRILTYVSQRLLLK